MKERHFHFIAILFCIIVPILSISFNPDNTVKPKDLKIFRSQESDVIVNNIKLWSKLGYSVTILTSQSIAIDRYMQNEKTDIILIMEK